ncbi:sigma factor-like helix-turn-helix DNA-binding protein [Actinomadura sp. J1-007]|uniref:sigma factor-like helix-turn-helix DNA-binding protein n=1 Tax=Actinomadura sp. J1-007 TaxID=2661913 RepID=UPI0035CD2770
MNGADAGGGAWDADPEHAALLTDSVGLALLVVLDTLDPAERLAFVLHDMFAVPFADIASVLGRSPAAARQLASRARRRVREAAPAPEDDPARRRKVVEAFLAAARGGDFDALVAVLDPDVVLRADTGAALAGTAGTAGAGGPVRGAAAVAGRALAFRRFAAHARPALVNGALGLVTVRDGRPVAVMAFAITGGRVQRIDILADPSRLARLDLPPLTP